MILLWPLTWLFFVPVIITIVLNNPFRKGQSAHVWIFTPFLITAIILALGTIRRYDGDKPIIDASFPSILLLVHIPVAGILIYWLKDFRWFTAALTLFQVWLSLVAAFISLMSISGDWL
jgi:ABC-type sugar transport system permease subunit